MREEPKQQESKPCSIKCALSISFN